MFNLLSLIIKQITLIELIKIIRDIDEKYYPAITKINLLFTFEITIIYALIVIISVKSVHTALIWWINSHATPSVYFIFL